MIIITFPDGSKLQYDKKSVTPLHIAKDIGEGLARAALAAKVNDKLVDLSYSITEDAEIRIITFKDDEGKEIFRHSTSHLMAAAVQNLFKDVKFAIGPAVEDGFYYDFDVKKPFTPEDLEKIEGEMRKLVHEDVEFIRKEISKKEAEVLFEKQPYKLEMIKDLDGVEIFRARGKKYDMEKFVTLIEKVVYLCDKIDIKE